MSESSTQDPRPDHPVGHELSQAQVEAIHQRILKQKSHSNGAGWFYWIAGLSLITSIVNLSGGSWSFLAGLGVTQLFDGFSIGLMKSGAGPWVKGLSLFLDLLAAGIFILVGILAKRGSKAAYLTGMALYGLDTLILLAFQEWFGTGFHLFALFQIWVGFSALTWLNGSIALDSQPAQPIPVGSAPLGQESPVLPAAEQP